MKWSDKFLLGVIGLWTLTTIVQAQPLSGMDMFFMFWLILAFWGAPTYLEGWERRGRLQFDLYLEQYEHGPNHKEAKQKIREALR